MDPLILVVRRFVLLTNESIWYGDLTPQDQYHNRFITISHLNRIVSRLQPLIDDTVFGRKNILNVVLQRI